MCHAATKKRLFANLNLALGGFRRHKEIFGRYRLQDGLRGNCTFS